MRRFVTIAIYATLCVVTFAAGLFITEVFEAPGATLSGAALVVAQQSSAATSAPTQIAQAPVDAAPTQTQPPATVVPSPTPQPSPQPTVAPTEVQPTSAPTEIHATVVPTEVQPTSAPSEQVAGGASEPAFFEYTIQKGDILYRIAAEYDVTIQDILAINAIANPESLKVGRVIRIPRK